MELKIWTPDEKKVEPVRVKLVQDGNFITNVAVSPDGRIMTDGNLLTLGYCCGIKRIGGVNPAFGFDLDHKGRIKVEGEDEPRTGRVRVNRQKLTDLVSDNWDGTMNNLVDNIIAFANDIFEAET